MKTKKEQENHFSMAVLIIQLILFYSFSCKKVPSDQIGYLKLAYDSMNTNRNSQSNSQPAANPNSTPTAGNGNTTTTPTATPPSTSNPVNASTPTPDIISPSPGNLGTLTVSDKKSISVKLSWTQGTDNITSTGDLEYKVLYSTANNIGTVDEMEATGSGRVLFLDWTKNISFQTITGLTVNTSYFLNVIIRDAAGNKAVYSVVNAVPPIIYDNLDGTITDSSRNITWMKCSAGQTWNPGPNDCTGTGDSGNNYSIGYYQYCATLNYTCNNTGSPDWVLNGNGTSGAWTYCDNLVLGGRSNWRVPTHPELNTMYGSVYSQVAYQPLFPNTGMAFYWTATADSTSANMFYQHPEEHAWIVHFQTGVTYANIFNSDGLKTNNALLRCVANGL